MKRLISDFQKYNITPVYEYGRISLLKDKDCDEDAFENYSRLLAGNPKIEIRLILELAKTDDDIRFQIEERAAIRAADNLPDDFESAVRCNLGEH